MKVLFLLSLIATGYCGVPVLIWETSGSNKGDDVPALSHLDSDDFSNFIVKKIHSHKPLIVLFEEETLSIEDFSWQDSQRKGSFPKLQNLTSMSAKVQFLPSVLDPVSALKDLVRSHDYVWKKYEKNGPSKSKMVLEVRMKDPLPNEDRPDLLRSHDTQIAEIYSNLLASNSRIIAIFTGKHSSWVEVDVNRVRREAKSDDEPLVYENNRIKIELSKNMTLTTPKSTYVLGKPTGTVGGDERDKSAKLVMTFSAPEKNDSSEKTGITLRPKFEEEGNEWNFRTIEIVINGETDTLSALSSIKANMGKSYGQRSDVIFKNAPGNITLVMNGLKAQLYNKGEPKALDKKFAESDSNNEMFFTAPILSGLLVSFILISILTYGFVMLSDIKTMDRFDDPKGKTIQVNASQD